MSNWQIGLAISPFLYLVVSYLVLQPLRRLFVISTPNGPVKAFLLSPTTSHKFFTVSVIVAFYVCLFTAVAFSTPPVH